MRTFFHFLFQFCIELFQLPVDALQFRVALLDGSLLVFLVAQVVQRPGQEHFAPFGVDWAE